MGIFQLSYSISKMKTFLLAFILFNIATFGEAMENCECIANLAMDIQGTDDVQALDEEYLKKHIMEIATLLNYGYFDEVDDCIGKWEWKSLWETTVCSKDFGCGCTQREAFETIQQLEGNVGYKCITMNEIKKAIQRLKKESQCPELQ